MYEVLYIKKKIRNRTIKGTYVVPDPPPPITGPGRRCFFCTFRGWLKKQARFCSSVFSPAGPGKPVQACQACARSSEAVGSTESALLAGDRVLNRSDQLRSARRRPMATLDGAMPSAAKYPRLRYDGGKRTKAPIDRDRDNRKRREKKRLFFFQSLRIREYLTLILCPLAHQRGISLCGC